MTGAGRASRRRGARPCRRPGRIGAAPVRSLALAGLAALAAAASVSPAAARPRPPLDGARLALALDRLQVLGAVLHVGAHPDDEDTALLAWCALGRGYHTGYVSLTRGDGGQNLVGAERGDALGLLRTAELLAARELDGAEQYFTRAIDFGYTKSADEALRTWNGGGDREAVLGDLVWVIRSFRPDAVVTRFPAAGGPPTHGHHTASAILAAEAFRAAGDPARFPEQLARVRPWRPRRLLLDVARDDRAGATSAEPRPHVTVDLGAYSALLGRSFTELAAESRGRHRSQGMGAAGTRGPAPADLVLLEGEPLPPGGADPLAGIDTGWSRLPADAGRVAELLARARRDFRVEQPEASVAALLAARAALDALAGGPAGSDPWIARKRAELDEAVRSAAGIRIESVADRAEAAPGDRVRVRTTVVNRSGLPFALDSVELGGLVLAAPGGDAAEPRALSPGAPVTVELTAAIREDASISSPPWLTEAHGAGAFAVATPEAATQPFGEPALVARATLSIQAAPLAPAAPGDAAAPAPAARLTFAEPVAFRSVDPAEGERWRDLVVVPPASVALDDPVVLFPDAGPRRVAVTVRSAVDRLEGTLRLAVPAGFRAEPTSAPIAIAERGGEARAAFLVAPPAAPATGRLRAELVAGGRALARGLVRVEHAHVPASVLFPPAETGLVRLDLAPSRGRIGYVPGPGDEVVAALTRAGYAVATLADAELDRGDLAGYDAVVVGIRAFDTRPRLAVQKARLLEYVAGGGTLVVQYQNPQGLVVDSVGPWPIALSADRVTDETAPVHVLAPGHALLARPNRIAASDLDGWVQERGTYFASAWDPRYDAPLACADAGEKETAGGLLYARYGKGVFVYTGYAFFRQLPAGVPGAYRLFANLVAGGRDARRHAAP